MNKKLLSLFAFVLAATIGFSQGDVTFKVDMNNYLGSYKAVNVSGTFNGWCADCNLLTDADNDGVYEVTVTIPQTSIDYKFQLDNWTVQENFAGGESCTRTDGGFTNRTLDISSDVVLSVACFNSCSKCEPPKDQIDLPIDFEGSDNDYSVSDFGGNGSSVDADPSSASNMVLKSVKSGAAETWAGTTLSTPAGLATVIPFDKDNNIISLDVYSPDASIQIRLKAEVVGEPTKSVETEATVTKSGEWETLSFDFTKQAMGTAAIDYSYDYNMISIFYNFGVDGATAGEKTYYLDNVMFGTPGPKKDPIDLPIDFEGSTVDYSVGDFGNNGSSVTAGPMSATNMVLKSVKSGTAETWAGTTLSTPTGLASAIPFDMDNNSITLDVYSPDAGIPIRLKAEVVGEPTKSVETEVMLTKSGEWETVTFDFTKQVTGTAAIDYANDYNMISIFYNFGTDGATAGEKTYYLDNVKFGGGVTGSTNDVTFSVDMNDYDKPYTDVFVAGTFNDWCEECAKMSDDDMDGVYEITIDMTGQTEVEYKFQVDKWKDQEKFAGGESCTKTAGEFVNRVYTVDGEATLPTVCWASCEACGVGAANVSVTFKVDMNQYEGTYTNVNLNGTFNEWCGECAVMMDEDKDGVYELAITLPENDTIEYKFTLDGWKAEEKFNGGESCTKTVEEFVNRTLVPTKDEELTAVCWESCADCANGLSELTTNMISVSPNPSNGIITLNLEKEFNGNVMIYDYQGKEIYNATNTIINNQSINLTGQPAGIYLIKVSSPETVGYTQFIIE